MASVLVPVRRLAKGGALSVTIVLVTGFAVGANTAIFTVVEAVMLRPLPYADPARLVSVERLWRDGSTAPVSVPEFLEWRRWTDVFSDLAAARWAEVDVAVEHELPSRIVEAIVTPNMFSLLGVQPLLGRLLVPSDTDPEHDRVMVLTEGAWRGWFKGNASVIGTRVSLYNGGREADHASYQVVGVVADSIRLRSLPKYAFYVPDVQARLLQGTWAFVPYFVIGRLKQGVSQAEAQSTLTPRIVALAHAHHDGSQVRGGVITSLQESDVRASKFGLAILFGIAVLVLLIACLNVMGLLLAAGGQRRGELALRLALGARRGQLVHQLAVEFMILALAGGVVALAVSACSARLLMAVVPGDLPRLEEVHMSPVVVGFSVAASLFSGLLFGILPAWLLTYVDPARILASSTHTVTHVRKLWGDLLLGLQLALVFALLLVTALFVGSLWRLRHVTLGFDPVGVLAAEMTLGPEYWRVPIRHAAFLRAVTDWTRSLQGVTNVALTFGLPPYSNGLVKLVLPDGQDIGPLYRVVSREYFSLLGVPLLYGRSLGDSRSQSGDVVVNEAFATKFLGGPLAVGERLFFSHGDAASWRIAGVVGDMREWRVEDPPTPTVYLNFLSGSVPAHFFMIARTNVEPTLLVGLIREEIRAIDPSLPVAFSTMEQHLGEYRAKSRFYAIALGAFSILALVLAGLGVYTIVYQTVAERTREIAVRVAMGASRRSIQWLVLRRLAVVAAVGLTLGIWAGLTGAGVIQSMVFEVRSLRVISLVYVAPIFVVVVIGAALVPTRRALTKEPNEVLRQH